MNSNTHWFDEFNFSETFFAQHHSLLCAIHGRTRGEKSAKKVKIEIHWRLYSIVTRLSPSSSSTLSSSTRSKIALRRVLTSESIQSKNTDESDCSNQLRTTFWFLSSLLLLAAALLVMCFVHSFSIHVVLLPYAIWIKTTTKNTVCMYMLYAKKQILQMEERKNRNCSFLGIWLCLRSKAYLYAVYGEMCDEEDETGTLHLIFCCCCCWWWWCCRCWLFKNHSK